MSNAIWGDPKTISDERYPIKLLKTLLQDVLREVPAYGACLAIYDESVNQMVIRLHMRRSDDSENEEEISLEPTNQQIQQTTRSPLRRNTMKLADKITPIPAAPKGQPSGSGSGSGEERFAVVTSTRQDALFPPGSLYPFGKDLVGVTWRGNQSLHVSHEQYQDLRVKANQQPIQETFTPGWYLTIPLREPEQTYEDFDRKRLVNRCLGIMILYQVETDTDFQQEQKTLAFQQAERISLYLQNDRLGRMQLSNRDHIKRLQQIGTTFPNTINLSDLVDEIYRFVLNTVDVSSMLLTLYDRDTKKLYDIFAINQSRRIEGLTERPVIVDPSERPQWWHVTQRDKRTLLLSFDKTEGKEIQAHKELLTGTWGNQTEAETFLLIPMKMFTRVIGSLSITSQRAQAYSPLEILVLETMVQIVTVALENAKLYERPRLALKQSQRREQALAATVSALQAISTVLNVNELLYKFVQIVANLAQVEMCSFFQLSPDGEDLVAQAIFDRSGKWKNLDGVSEVERQEHEELIQLIRLPYKNSLLEDLVNEAFFYLDQSYIEALAQNSGESGAIFLRETHTQKLLVVPVRYQTIDLVGIVALHTRHPNRNFAPEEIGILMAISAQAAGAIRNAQLFEQIQEANAELKHMDEVKDEFIKTASHELRTPLSAISGYSSLLKRQGENGRTNPEQTLKFAIKIVNSTQQLTDLVDNMTQAVRMGALSEKLDLDLEPSQLLAAAETATAMLNINIDQQITVEIGADLWVNSDSLRLRQVITNLLDNAAKYSPPHGRILITARATPLSWLPDSQVDYNIIANGEDPEVVIVRVCDEGQGIDLEDAEKIFEKFVRAPHSLTTPVRGTGLGLFICRRFIEAMGGRLWLERSVPGQGSIFSFYLMRIPQPVETREQDEPEAEPATQDEESSYPTVESLGRG
jgi:signal transduction histidine kinase